ncbi:1-phosphofructokinase [Clostridium cellulovorans]|uniref:Tagatose-6-phosphate kinase n=1 Tax=Clostridium cellulovorans (strain ATCC 35296 / DSM 3052 / OCM 3 / 743B) TaxID=573061 RepID=D9SMS9_CLOC7|nr:1-phosphofructokinase [Clostridium cellulovorans]ADL49864.1 1-phosphofructokinase [Clostridium cellulovorans 743B]
MIYTVTLNPSIDYIVKVDDFSLGEVNRTEVDEKYPGGKGINVSRVLKHLGVESKALGFVGGFTGYYIKESLKGFGVETDFIEVEEDTRINIKIKSNMETEINGAGPKISEDKFNELKEKIAKLKDNDVLVLAGSVQSSLSKDTYVQLIKALKSQKIKVVVDTTRELLLSTLTHKPFLIKPNKSELAELFNTKIDSLEEVIEYASKLREMGAENVIVSMAGDGSLLICDQGVFRAKAPKGQVKNSVGAGDSLVAGFIEGYTKTKDIKEALVHGTASGSATAFSMDLCTKEEFELILDKVEVNKLY